MTSDTFSTASTTAAKRPKKATQTHSGSRFDTPHQYIDVGHSDIAYWRFGQGPDLVLIHGWPLKAATFRNLIPTLAQHYTCHCIDLPGAGLSRYTSQTPFGLTAHAQTVQTVIQQLGLSHFALLGHDSGGAIARFIAAEAGDSVYGVVLGNTEIPHHEPLLLKMLVGLGKIPGAFRLFTHALSWKWLRHSQFGFGSCFSNAELSDGEFYQLFVSDLQSTEHQSGQRRNGQLEMLRHFSPADIHKLEAAHQRITAPSVLLWGDEDPYFPIAQAEQMLYQFKGGAELKRYPKGRLLVHEEFPQRFAEDTVVFLNRCRKGKTKAKQSA